jgi:hypothetical protein
MTSAYADTYIIITSITALNIVLWDASSIASYPNPVTRSIRLGVSAGLIGKKADISITDIVGRQVIRKELSITAKEVEIDLWEIAVGQYLLQFKADTLREVIRFVKELH